MLKIDRLMTDIKTSLKIRRMDKEMVLYHPLTCQIHDAKNYNQVELEEDLIYYQMLKSNLDLILKDFSQGWIKSERQLIFTHPSCISFVQFILNTEKEVEEVFIVCRSTNIQQMQSDVQFFINYIQSTTQVPFSEHVFLNFNWNMPHLILKHWNETYEKNGVSKI